jgi:lysophospholipase L1-like esterase
MFTVGGSTTECGYLSDGLTWTDRVGQRLSESFDQFWINNAGLDGTTTHGHLELLQGYLVDFSPDVVVFLIGYNDSMGPEANRFDRALGTLGTGPLSFSSFKGFLISLSERSITVRNAINVYRGQRFRRRGGWSDFIEWQSEKEGEPLPPNGKKELRIHQEVYIPLYKERVERILSVTRAQKILAVLVTQPIPFGASVDPDTGKNLARVRYGAFKRARIELYNNVLRDVASTQDVPLVDLARQMPKRTSLFFDEVHFTLRGEEVASEIISQELLRILNDHFESAHAGYLQLASSSLRHHIVGGYSRGTGPLDVW